MVGVEVRYAYHVVRLHGYPLRAKVIVAARGGLRLRLVPLDLQPGPLRGGAILGRVALGVGGAAGFSGALEHDTLVGIAPIGPALHQGGDVYRVGPIGAVVGCNTAEVWKIETRLGVPDDVALLPLAGNPENGLCIGTRSVLAAGEGQGGLVHHRIGRELGEVEAQQGAVAVVVAGPQIASAAIVGVWVNAVHVAVLALAPRLQHGRPADHPSGNRIHFIVPAHEGGPASIRLHRHRAFAVAVM